MLRLIGTMHYPARDSIQAVMGDFIQIGDEYNVPICLVDVQGVCHILGFHAWEDENGRCFISIIDGLRTCSFIDGPYYRLSLQWDHESGSFPRVSMAKRGPEADVLLYPVWDEAWVTP